MGLRKLKLTLLILNSEDSKKLIKSKHFLLLLPDDIINGKNSSKELIAINKKTNSSVIAIRKVIKKDVKRYGIVGFDEFKNLKINKMVEKPSVKNSPSQFAIIGRYILPAKIFDEIKTLKPGSGGEIHITDAIKKLIKKNYKFL